MSDDLVGKVIVITGGGSGLGRATGLLAAERGAPVVLEASGVQPEHLASYAASGIDLISSSAPITRSPWLDISMRFARQWV